MSASNRRTPAKTFLFVGLVGFLLLIPLLVLVPLFQCPNCDGHAVILWTTGARPKSAQDPRVIIACGRCKATGRITIVNLVIVGPEVAN
jgi:hypothetical protein